MNEQATQTLDLGASVVEMLIGKDNDISNLKAINAELLEALEQAALELDEAANLLQGTFKGSASLMRVAAEKHRAAIAKAKGE